MKRFILSLNIINVIAIFACFVIANLNNVTTPIASPEQINTTVLGMISLIASYAIYVKFQEINSNKWKIRTKTFINTALTLFTLLIAVKYLLVLLANETIIIDFSLAVANAINIILLMYVILTAKLVK